MIDPFLLIFSKHNYLSKYLNRASNPRNAFENKSYAPSVFHEAQNGGGEIRTPGALRHSGFQNRCTKPLCDPSMLLHANSSILPEKYRTAILLFALANSILTSLCD